MFESASLGRAYAAEEYKRLAEEWRMRLFQAQQDARAAGVPVLITVAGVDGSGRGQVANLLSEWMDAKGIHNHTFWLETDEERARPEAWRYWRSLPGAGEIGVFFGGWYGGAIRTFCCGGMEEKDFEARMQRRVRLERALAASGMVLVKLWLHLDRATFKERRKERKKHKEIHHFAPYDKQSGEEYEALIRAASRAVTLTDRVDAPWTLVDAKNPHFRDITVVRAVTEAVERALAARKAGPPPPDAAAPAEDLREAARPAVVSALDAFDLSAACAHEAYGKELAELQADLFDLSYRAYRKGISSTLVFEGWDAAGKGGTIRRLTAGVDARITRVIPVGAPTDEELAHHYLWRFWRHVPMAGFVTVYDRSWYGRVLVERVEHLTAPDDWRRAYAEINDFEEQLREGGNILLKFWLHISEDEQLRRFRERETVPWKKYKITPEDWRNRDKRRDYLVAADEMFARTSTDYAPWHIVAAEDKKCARLEVLRLYRDALKKALRERR
ncbi:MAG: polyphosphate:AMP phosphotransferase [Desulfovibrionaceae bacterium]|nr:polyphosphate:AMP phosphotransferase [Desulfovibrionaceae bacterium]